ncbi:polysaccharide biosynthesis/export family protein [Bosea sp. ASV33]|uniref:polysaccharide biosynthesis/export family protein n=1 Tax=Bosea sp. ASV33 TaxID=2795106 RepID=UPI0032BF2D94
MIEGRGLRRRHVVIALALLMPGCAGFTPQDAPNGQSVQSSAQVSALSDERVNYALVSMSPDLVRATNTVTAASLGSMSSLGGGRGGGDVTIGIGDIVSVTIFEAASGGLFIPREAGSRSGNFVDIPRQQVDQSGSITVPYAGTIRVAGMTARAVSGVIRDRIKDRAIDPQAVVSVAEQRGNQISILGDVSAPLRFAIDPGGIRLLGAIARAGGPRSPAYETVVTVKRGTRMVRQMLSDIIKKPSDDVFMSPGDVIYLSREPRFFLVFGSTPSPGSIGGTNNRRFSFENDRMTLAEAIAKAGGLDGSRANSKAVYVLRAEARTLLERGGIDTSTLAGERIPTVYGVDFSKPDGLFLANSFQVRDRDVIFVSEAPSIELIKMLNVISPITSSAANIDSIGR